jgi:hypothetical protein
MEKLITEALGAAGIGGIMIVVLVFLSRHWYVERLKNSIKHEYDVILTDYGNELRKKTDTELAKVNATLSMEIELTKLRMGPYSEKQFDLYNDLWRCLCDLKHAMELLWDHASGKNVTDFASRLADASHKLEQSSLLVEPGHYRELNDLLNQFGNYQLGKEKLIELRGDRTGRNPIDETSIQRLIDQNGENRQNLLAYLPQMMQCMRSQISGERIALYNRTEDQNDLRERESF